MKADEERSGWVDEWMSERERQEADGKEQTGQGRQEAESTASDHPRTHLSTHVPIHSSTHPPTNSLERWLKRLRGGFWVGLGFMLSPLSWWNDLFFNLPIAYGFGYLARFFAPEWFLPATVVGYWLSNVLGILMMQFGATDVLFENRERNLKKDVLMGIGTSTLYTLAVVALVYFHVLETPQLFP